MYNIYIYWNYILYSIQSYSPPLFFFCEDKDGLQALQGHRRPVGSFEARRLLSHFPKRGAFCVYGMWIDVSRVSELEKNSSYTETVKRQNMRIFFLCLNQKMPKKNMSEKQQSLLENLQQPEAILRKEKGWTDRNQIGSWALTKRCYVFWLLLFLKQQVLVDVPSTWLSGRSSPVRIWANRSSQIGTYDSTSPSQVVESVWHSLEMIGMVIWGSFPCRYVAQLERYWWYWYCWEAECLVLPTWGMMNLFRFFFKIVIPSGFGEVDHELIISGHVPHQNSLILQVLAHFHP